MSEAAEQLEALGFTGLEAEIYLLLLRGAAVTGYRIAQQLGKPTGNVYKALETLEQKGAILVDEGENRLVRPVAPSELLGQLERRFQARRVGLERALADIAEESEDHRLYTLRSYEQVIERFRAMLARCERVALLDLFPAPLAALRPDIEAAIARGVAIYLEVYEPVELPGGDVALSVTPEQTIELWPGQALHAVSDAREWMVALFSRDGTRVVQAVWSASRFLATTQFACLAAEFVQSKLRGWIAEGRGPEEIEAALAPYEMLRLRHTPGFGEFRARVGGGDGPRPTEAG